MEGGCRADDSKAARRVDGRGQDTEIGKSDLRQEGTFPSHPAARAAASKGRSERLA